MRRASAALVSFALAATFAGVAAPGASAQDPSPWIEVHPDQQWVGGHGFTPGAEVSVSLNDTLLDGDPTTVGDDGTFGYGSPDAFGAGDTILVTDGTLAKTLVVAPLSVDEVAGTTISGTASPGATSVQLWVNDTDPFVQRTEIVSAGAWSINVAVEGDELPAEAATLDALEPGMDGAVREADEDGDVTHVDWRVSDPRISVYPVDCWVNAEDIATGAAITITRGGELLVDGEFGESEEGDTRFECPDGVEIQAGDVVTVTDGQVEKVHAVTALTIDQIDGNTVSGAASAGQVHFWMNDTDPGLTRTVEATDGTWSVDVANPGPNPGEEVTADLGPGSSGAAVQQDEDHDATHVDWRIWNPFITAAVGDTGINGNDFVPGATVEVKLNNDVIGTATVEDWSDFSLESPRPLEVGDTIVVTPSKGVAKTLVVTGITISEPIEGNVISGTGAAGSYINLGVDCDGNAFNRNVAIDDNGSWSEDLGNPGDEDWENQTAELVRGCGGNALDTDEDGDATVADWHIANPQLIADLTSNVVYGSDFGGDVSVTIEAPDGAAHTWTEGIEYWDDGFGLWLYTGPYADEPWTLGAGQTITASGPNGMASLVVADLVVEGWDYDANTVWGTTDQSGPVTAEAMHADKEYDSFQIDEPGTEWEIGLVDIRIMDTGGVWQFDAEGDLTSLHLTYGPTRFLFSPLYQQIVGSDWVDGTPVSLTIDPVADGTPDYTPPAKVAGPLDCNVRGACPAWQVPLTGHVNVFFDLTDTGFQARVGDVITMRQAVDGTTTIKSLVVPDLSVDLPEPDSGEVTGKTTSPMPGFLTVGTRVEDMCDAAHDVLPEDLGPGGSWAVSFSDECQVQPGSVTATETDVDGDQTWITDPVIDLRVEPVMDRIWAAWWAPANVTLTIERGSTQVFTTDVLTRNVLTRGSWNLDMWTQPVGTLDAPMMALFDLSSGGPTPFDIRAGDVLTVSDGTVTRTVTVANLAVTSVSAATDTVTGTAAPGQTVGFHLWDGEEGYWGYETTAGTDGAWAFVFDPDEFPGQGLDPGMNGQAFGPDNTTVIRWTVPSGIATTTTITGDVPDPTVVGQAYLVRISVQRTGAGSGRPQGAVTVSDGRGATCTDTTPAKIDSRTSGFSCSVRSMSAGPVTLTATFAPSPGWAPSTGTASHMAGRAATTTSITNAGTLAAKVTKVGVPYTVAVRVAAKAPGSGTPSGSVTVSDGSATCSVPALSATGTGSCQLVSMSAGLKTITARYDGSAGYLPSTGSAAHRVR